MEPACSKWAEVAAVRVLEEPYPEQASEQQQGSEPFCTCRQEEHLTALQRHFQRRGLAREAWVGGQELQGRDGWDVKGKIKTYKQCELLL